MRVPVRGMIPSRHLPFSLHTLPSPCARRRVQAPAHRIDKPVSGVFILGRSQRGSWQLGAAMSAEGSQKRYLARVRGRFPGGGAPGGEPVTVDCPLRMTRLRGMNGRLAQCACTTPPSALDAGHEDQQKEQDVDGQGQEPPASKDTESTSSATATEQQRPRPFQIEVLHP